jgi:hypothetical protein
MRAVEVVARALALAYVQGRIGADTHSGPDESTARARAAVLDKLCANICSVCTMLSPCVECAGARINVQLTRIPLVQSCPVPLT